MITEINKGDIAVVIKSWEVNMSSLQQNNVLPEIVQSAYRWCYLEILYTRYKKKKGLGLGLYRNLFPDRGSIFRGRKSGFSVVTMRRSNTKTTLCQLQTWIYIWLDWLETDQVFRSNGDGELGLLSGPLVFL